jgi:hypothetical protein
MSRKLLYIILINLVIGVWEINIGKAQNYVAIPDSNFIHYLKTLIPSAFKGDSLNRTNNLVTTMLGINADNLGIADLNGIQYFTSLMSLSCSTNSLTSLPALPNTVTYIYCNHNNLTSLPTLPSTLGYLECDTNQLTSIPTLPYSLQYLSCLNNNIAVLPTLPSSLNYLDCGNNSITTLPSIPNSLTYLSCQNNSLISLPPLPNKLQYLYCWSNSLTSLPAFPDSLAYLDCSNNHITCFPTFPNKLTNHYHFLIDPNPYNCLPNYVTAMSSMDLATPLCAAGNSNGCPVSVAGIEQFVSNKEQVTVYPNPASTILNVAFIKNTESSNTIKLVNLIGQTVYSNVISKNDVIDISGLAKGIYMLIITDDNNTAYRKVVIE